MHFFKKAEKEKALKTSQYDLKMEYEQSEDKLKAAAFTCDDKCLKAEMKNHRLLEYAMLYQHTPQYAKKIKKG